jgi:oxaloacetate decarboxylase gamma subunit
MTIAEMLEQSGVLTLLGMGIVFGFLIILIVTVSLMGKVMSALGLNTDTGTPAKTAGAPAAGNKAVSGAAVTAAISAAVNEYRKK